MLFCGNNENINEEDEKIKPKTTTFYTDHHTMQCSRITLQQPRRTVGGNANQPIRVWKQKKFLGMFFGVYLPNFGFLFVLVWPGSGDTHTDTHVNTWMDGVGRL